MSVLHKYWPELHWYGPVFWKVYIHSKYTLTIKPQLFHLTEEVTDDILKKFDVFWRTRVMSGGDFFIALNYIFNTTVFGWSVCFEWGLDQILQF